MKLSRKVYGRFQSVQQNVARSAPDDAENRAMLVVDKQFRAAEKRHIDTNEGTDPTGVGRVHYKLAFRDLVMDLRAQRVSREGKSIKLRPVEFRLLQHFLEHPEQVFSRAELLSIIWGESLHVGSRTVDIHIGRLRKALNRYGQRNYIRTVHSRGYSLDLQE